MRLDLSASGSLKPNQVHEIHQAQLKQIRDVEVPKDSRSDIFRERAEYVEGRLGILLQHVNHGRAIARHTSWQDILVKATREACTRYLSPSRIMRSSVIRSACFKPRIKARTVPSSNPDDSVSSDKSKADWTGAAKSDAAGAGGGRSRMA